MAGEIELMTADAFDAVAAGLTSAESTRATAESARVSAEQNRVSAESTRVQNEDTRIANDVIRITTVDSIDALRAFSLVGLTNGRRMNTSGYYNRGDGGGNEFYWDAASTADDNGGTVIRPSGVAANQPGRWLESGGDRTVVYAVRFGVRNGTNAQTVFGAGNVTGIRNALAWAQSQQIGEVRLPGGLIYVNDTIDLVSFVNLTGSKLRFTGTRLKRTSSSFPILRFGTNFTTDVTLRELQFEQLTNALNDTIPLVDAGWSSNCLIEKCDFVNVAYAISLQNQGSYLYIDYCNFEKCDKAIHLRGFSGLQVTRSRFIRDRQTPVEGNCHIILEKLGGTAVNANNTVAQTTRFRDCHFEYCTFDVGISSLQVDGIYYKTSIRLNEFSSFCEFNGVTASNVIDNIYDIGYQNRVFACKAQNTGWYKTPTKLMNTESIVWDTTYNQGKVSFTNSGRDIFFSAAIAGDIDDEQTDTECQIELLRLGTAAILASSQEVSLYGHAGSTGLTNIRYKTAGNLFCYTHLLTDSFTDSVVIKPKASKTNKIFSRVAASLITNGRLQSGGVADLTGWTNSIPWELQTVESGLVRLTNTSGSAALRRQISVTVGKHYMLAIKHKRPNLETFIRVGQGDLINNGLLFIAESNLLNDGIATSDNFFVSQCFFTAETNTVNIGVVSSVLNASIDVDWVAVLETEV